MKMKEECFNKGLVNKSTGGSPFSCTQKGVGLEKAMSGVGHIWFLHMLCIEWCLDNLNWEMY